MQENLKQSVSRYVTAKGYLLATQMIAASPSRENEGGRDATVLPMNMLIGFALELYFKSWLLDAGRDTSAVRAFGHKVKLLHEEARNDGLPLIPLLDQLVEALGPGHEDFTHRYINSGDEVSLIRWNLAFAVLSDLDTAVENKLITSGSINASVSSGQSDNIAD